MRKILTIVGARPQFIKAAALSRVLRNTFKEVLVHTGQHFDANMSDIFFEELDIPMPDYNLGISGGTHAQMTARMLISIEEKIIEEKPDLVLLYGDTNSTLAGALASVKCHVPIAHVEAGGRVGTLNNPEEVNRILTDHVSRYKFACVESAMSFLEKENLLENAYLVGDPMYDAFLYYTNESQNHTMDDLVDFKGNPVKVGGEYCYLTCHRQENTDDISKLANILDALEDFGLMTVYPVHPRNRNMVQELQTEHEYRNIRFIQPVGYLSSIKLVSGANHVVTDSGGVQREAFFAGVPCVTVLDFVCWPETMVYNRNVLVAPEKSDILSKLNLTQKIDDTYQPFGDGNACGRITNILKENL